MTEKLTQCNTSATVLCVKIQTFKTLLSRCNLGADFSIAQQSTAFLCSLVFGAAAGLLYDIFKIIRMTLCKGKASVFVTDFLYVFIVSLNLFIFSVAYMLGFFRVFVTVGSFLGFVICRLTLGRLLSLVYCPMIRFTESVCVKISQKLKKSKKAIEKQQQHIV